MRGLFRAVLNSFGMAARGFSPCRMMLRPKAGLSALLFCAGLAACSKSPVPSGVFLSLSVSAGDVAVETGINGEANDYLSGMSGNMVSSGPVNANLSEGANEISFTLSRGPEAGEDVDPWFLAALEVSVKGEIVDTARPGDRLIFQRELTEAEVQKLLAGEKLVLTETFSVSRDALKAIKDSAEMAPKLEPAEPKGH